MITVSSVAEAASTILNSSEFPLELEVIGATNLENFAESLRHKLRISDYKLYGVGDASTDKADILYIRLR